jgi:hypothetical protein
MFDEFGRLNNALPLPFYVQIFTFHTSRLTIGGIKKICKERPAWAWKELVYRRWRAFLIHFDLPVAAGDPS